MSGRDWKPGDVAETDYNGVKSRAMVVEGRSCPDNHSRTMHWHGASGGWNQIDDALVTYRALVVIDPENREQVERLREAASMWADRVPYSDMAEPGDLTHLDAMQEALRSLLAPPKPDEPQGLGAVVEDAEGHAWIRMGAGPAAWMLAGASPSNRDTYPYSGIAAVKVLSKGVTA